MSQRLPIGNYRWVSERKINRHFNSDDAQKNASSISNLNDESDIGYIFEVDLHYPPELHHMHNDFPFCPEKRGIPKITTNDKLLLTFYDKNNYVVHYSMLKLALKHGLKLKKVHRVLQFRQSAWLKPYIELNSMHRAQACNDFEKDNYKLMNNAIYGKTLENQRLRADIRLINKWEGRVGGRSLIARPNFKNCKVFDENLISIEMHKSHILINRPIIVGMCVLEISKILMYKFLYEYLKPKYGENIQVVYTDTDSFVLKIKTNDFYADIRDEPDASHFDTSAYPVDNIYGIKRQNKKILGKFKDEVAGKIITEFVGLRSKCYSLRTLCEIKEIKKAKGVKKGVLKSNISFDDYFNCIKNNCIEMRKQYTICSKSHNVFTISTDKIALNPFDDKRYIIKPECIETLAWGHYELDSVKMTNEYQHVLDTAQRVKECLKNMKEKNKTISALAYSEIN